MRAEYERERARLTWSASIANIDMIALGATLAVSQGSPDPAENRQGYAWQWLWPPCRVRAGSSEVWTHRRRLYKKAEAEISHREVKATGKVGETGTESPQNFQTLSCRPHLIRVSTTLPAEEGCRRPSRSLPPVDVGLRSWGKLVRALEAGHASSRLRNGSTPSFKVVRQSPGSQSRVVPKGSRQGFTPKAAGRRFVLGFRSINGITRLLKSSYMPEEASGVGRKLVRAPKPSRALVRSDCVRAILRGDVLRSDSWPDRRETLQSRSRDWETRVYGVSGLWAKFPAANNYLRGKAAVTICTKLKATSPAGTSLCETAVCKIPGPSDEFHVVSGGLLEKATVGLSHTRLKAEDLS
ncbi:hypothetical protein F4779DRAFT_621332 [Xylariaceae sp. FL0662B]|nr:hypothetical protein F4779DRAFT_621332 [Xylariaceae sp. FL0662B]